MLRQQVPSPGQGVGGGFVAGDKEYQTFVNELFFGHAFPAVFVSRVEEHLEEVVVYCVALPALANDVGHH